MAASGWPSVHVEMHGRHLKYCVMIVLCDREASDGPDTTCICVAVVRSMKLAIDLVGWPVPKKLIHVS